MNQNANCWYRRSDLDIHRREKEFKVIKILFKAKESKKKKKRNGCTQNSFCNETEFSPHPSSSSTQSLGSVFFPPSLPPSFMACWPWHLTVPPSDMPCCQEFSSFELCTTTNHILYNLDDSHSRNHESKRKRQKWGSVLRGGQNSQSKRCLLSEKKSPVVPLKHEERWYFVFTYVYK